jgi:hypothetical protein
MHRFWFRLSLFMLPFAAAFTLLTGFLLYTGESLPLPLVARAQMGDTPTLYRPRFGNRDLQFKLLSAELRRPEIIALGSSHVLQIRSNFFDRSPQAFYNAGAPAWQLEHLAAFLERLQHTPDLIILGIDHPWFNDAYEGDPSAPSLEPTSDFETIFAVNRTFMQILFSGERIDAASMLARRDPGDGQDALGLRAIRDGHGFRNDGSEQYGDFLVARHLYPENERARHFSLMQNGEQMYARGAVVSESALAAYADLLDAAQARGIDVIGFLSPFAPTLYEAMLAGGEHTYLLELPGRLAALHAERGFAFFDFTDPSLLHATDGDFFDGWHASERIFLRLYLHMLETHPDLLARYSDLDALRAIEANAVDTFRVFGGN